jgi:hypothetical protein
VLRKIKRKLIAIEKQQLENELIKETETSNGDLQEDLDKSNNMEEERAITLKEAYDRAIRKVDQSKRMKSVLKFYYKHHFS